MRVFLADLICECGVAFLEKGGGKSEISLTLGTCRTGLLLDILYSKILFV